MGEAEDKTVALVTDNLLLRGSSLRNTAWVYGIALNTVRSPPPHLRRDWAHRCHSCTVGLVFACFRLPGDGDEDDDERDQTAVESVAGPRRSVGVADRHGILGAMQARCTVLQMEIIVNYSLGFILLTLIVIITISTALAQALARMA